MWGGKLQNIATVAEAAAAAVVVAAPTEAPNRMRSEVNNHLYRLYAMQCEN